MMKLTACIILCYIQALELKKGWSVTLYVSSVQICNHIYTKPAKVCKVRVEYWDGGKKRFSFYIKYM